MQTLACDPFEVGMYLKKHHKVGGRRPTVFVVYRSRVCFAQTQGNYEMRSVIFLLSLNYWELFMIH